MTEPMVHYIVTVERRETRSVPVQSRQCIKEKPTGVTDNNYGRNEVAYEREYQMVDGVEQRQSKEQVFQQIVEERDFSLEDVIAAINGFGIKLTAGNTGNGPAASGEP